MNSPRYRVTIRGSSVDAMADLIRKYRIQVFDHRNRRRVEGAYAVDALADFQQIRELEAVGYTIARHEDVDKEGKARQTEVGEGDRYWRPEES
jgi:hypothetical protein